MSETNRPDTGYRPSKGRRIAAYAVAVLTGVAHPWLLVMQVLLPIPGILLALLLTAAVFAMGGTAPAVVLMSTAAASAVVLLGTELGLASLPMLLLPGLMLLAASRRNMPFFDRLSRTIAAALLGCLITALVTTRVLGGSIVDIVFSFMRSVYQENSALFMSVLSANGVNVSAAEAAKLYNETIDAMQLYYSQNQLTNMITGGCLSAVLATAWGSRLRSKVDGGRTQWVPLEKWYMPSGMTIGLLITLAAAYGLTYTTVDAAVQTWRIVKSLAMLAFLIQMAASLDRSMVKKAWSARRRTVFLCFYAVVVFMGRDMQTGSVGCMLLAMAGAASALFGSHGALRAYLDKGNE